MNCEDFIIRYEKAARELRLPFSPDDFLGWIVNVNATPAELDLLDTMLTAMIEKKNESSINTLKKLSRIPQKNPLLFENFNLDLLNAGDICPDCGESKTNKNVGSGSFCRKCEELDYMR